MTDTVALHKKDTPASARVAVVTLSDTRTLENDVSGSTIKDLLTASGHRVMMHTVIADEADAIRGALHALVADPDLQLVVFNGGTGLAPRDVTVETVREMFDKELTAFGTMFAMLSWEQVGSACLLSRATAGVVKGRLVYCLPGSPKACKLAMEKLILPEIGHMLKQIGPLRP